MMIMKERQSLFKEVMSNYPTGVTVVTTIDRIGYPVGLTVNSFTSVSLDPLLVLWSIDNRSSSIDAFIESNKFAVHVLTDNQQELGKNFASKKVNHAERFRLHKWNLSNHSLPIVEEEECLAVLQCKTYKRIVAGDHTIFIGEVEDVQMDSKDPLLYFRRNFTAVPN